MLSSLLLSKVSFITILLTLHISLIVGLFETSLIMPGYSSSESELSAIKNDKTFCFSDKEECSEVDKGHSDTMKDYWVGKKYFECALAQKTLEDNATEEILTVIDVCYQFIPSYRSISPKNNADSKTKVEIRDRLPRI